MAIKIDYPDREVLLELDPSVFYLTDHYRPYPAVLVRLRAVSEGLVAELLEKAWRFQAPRKLLTAGVQGRTRKSRTGGTRRQRAKSR